MNETHTETNHTTDQIRADRACAGCGFNLFGQSVTKEEHYGLAIARCPECGTVAALQQYPVMTHWVNRFRLIIGAIYVLILVGAFVASTAAISGFTFGATNIASQNLAEHIAFQYGSWSSRQSNATGQGTAPAAWTYRYSNLEQEFVETQLGQVMGLYGNLWDNADREWVIIMIPMLCVCFGVGVFWSVTLLGSTRKRAVLLPLASCLIAAALIVAINKPDPLNASVNQYATQLYVPIIVPIVLSLALSTMMFGVWIGRIFARFMIVLALPPRSRVPFSIFWTRDGLELPRP